ncbi:MAG: hypothetical protein AAGI28_01150 [Pseudomonadota bacterium]
MDWTLEAPREQAALSGDPYDCWVSPQGFCMAEFRHVGHDYLIRFPGQADFLLQPEKDTFHTSAWPSPDCDGQTVANLYHNAIEPILGNHSGGLFLHGSAVVLQQAKRSFGEGGAIAFLGLSRGGKTTLAGSFAAAGFPFLTEDVIDLRMEKDLYLLQPKRSKLRLFADSARFLLGADASFADENIKQEVVADEGLPFAETQAPLRQIYILGADHAAPISIRRLSNQDALSALLPHAFILDVTDKARLKAHFERMADLSQDIACHALDFTRDYAELPKVRDAVLKCFASLPS